MFFTSLLMLLFFSSFLHAEQSLHGVNNINNIIHQFTRKVIYLKQIKNVNINSNFALKRAISNISGLIMLEVKRVNPDQNMSFKEIKKQYLLYLSCYGFKSNHLFNCSKHYNKLNNI